MLHPNKDNFPFYWNKNECTKMHKHYLKRYKFNTRLCIYKCEKCFPWSYGSYILYVRM